MSRWAAPARRTHPGAPALPAAPGTRARRAVALAAAAVAGLVLTSCGTDVDDITQGPGFGWTAAHNDGRNSGTTAVEGSRQLGPAWQRPLGGPVAAPVTVGSQGQMFVTTRTANCAIFSFQMSGRKRFCNQLGPNAVAAPTLLDSANNVYVGDDSGVNSDNYLGQPRWRTPVAGVPVTLQFTGDGHVLSITQTGQVDVLERQTGKRMVPTVQLLGEPDFLRAPDLTWPAAGQGLDDCATGGPSCAVATRAAVDGASGRIYATVWEPGRPAAALVALRYTGDRIERLWSAELLTEGAAAGPTVSADGSTVYVGDNSGRLLALDTADGRTRWVHELGWTPRGGLSVDADGLIVPAGDEGYLLALRDTGDAVEPVWERKDLALRGTPVQTAGGTGYTVAAIGDGLTLITFDTETGATVDSDVLPDAQGTTTGTAVGPEGEVVTATRIGELFVFTPVSQG
ncbi:PQQ-binding-like beta-propeller repeat protein [Nocardia sp. NPDC050697]|uniref:outer membrane protein assembly factor BamB family protein n=1 Tax=Nocardia sp. NPDC050697 TaxID=3155158 RepID=UPI00340AF32F